MKKSVEETERLGLQRWAAFTEIVSVEEADRLLAFVQAVQRRSISEENIFLKLLILNKYNLEFVKNYSEKFLETLIKKQHKNVFKIGKWIKQLKFSTWSAVVQGVNVDSGRMCGCRYECIVYK